MTDDTSDWDRREQAVRIDKLIAETHKLVAEQGKWLAEARKYRWIDPLLALATIIAALGITRFFGH